MRFGHLTSKFEYRDCLLPADRQDTVEKIVERISGFKVVVQRPHWHSRSHEHRCTAENLRIAVYDRARVWHGSCSVSEYTLNVGGVDAPPASHGVRLRLAGKIHTDIGPLSRKMSPSRTEISRKSVAMKKRPWIQSPI